ncbi:MAG: leucine-rich repeat domain-containing protein [Bifidobacteriaceae bacterium]|jgi:hypothetical protein|nr:leucine-rich repeat domain-containing protein [Bifidobacteriaceae bacterium]
MKISALTPRARRLTALIATVLAAALTAGGLAAPAHATATPWTDPATGLDYRLDHADNTASLASSNQGKTLNLPDGTLRVPARITADGQDYDVNGVGSYAFYKWPGLTAVDFSAATKLARIEMAAFRSTPLTRVTFPEAPKDLQLYDWVFHGTALTEVTLPDGVINVGQMAFADIKSLASITIAPSTDGIYIHDNAFSRGALTSVTLPDGIRRLGIEAFSDNHGLASVTIAPQTSDLLLGDRLFQGAVLRDITIPEGVTYIGAGAFKDIRTLTSLTVTPRQGSGLSIGEGAFERTGITSLTLPDTVLTMHDRAFAGNPQLTSVDLSGAHRLSYVGAGAFLHDGITDLRLPGGDQYRVYEEDAFANQTIIAPPIAFDAGGTAATRPLASLDGAAVPPAAAPTGGTWDEATGLITWSRSQGAPALSYRFDTTAGSILRPRQPLPRFSGVVHQPWSAETVRTETVRTEAAPAQEREPAAVMPVIRAPRVAKAAKRTRATVWLKSTEAPRAHRTGRVELRVRPGKTKPGKAAAASGSPLASAHARHGKARLRLPKNLKPGIYWMTATFRGNAQVKSAVSKPIKIRITR